MKIKVYVRSFTRDVKYDEVELTTPRILGSAEATVVIRGHFDPEEFFPGSKFQLELSPVSETGVGEARR